MFHRAISGDGLIQTLYRSAVRKTSRTHDASGRNISFLVVLRIFHNYSRPEGKPVFGSQKDFDGGKLTFH